jgi:hypothetical protein
VKALRITPCSESRAQGRLKSDPLGGSPRSAPLAGAQLGAWPRLNVSVFSKCLGDQPLVAVGGMGRFPPVGLEREMSEAAIGGRWSHRQETTRPRHSAVPLGTSVAAKSCHTCTAPLKMVSGYRRPSIHSGASSRRAGHKKERYCSSTSKDGRIGKACGDRHVRPKPAHDDA